MSLEGKADRPDRAEPLDLAGDLGQVGVQVVTPGREVGAEVGSFQGTGVDDPGGGERSEGSAGTTGEDQTRHPEHREQLRIGGSDAAHRSHLGRQAAVEYGDESGQAAFDLLDEDDVGSGNAELCTSK